MAKTASRKNKGVVFLTPHHDIAHRLGALRKRLADLDEKLVPARDGVIDWAVSAAMGAVEAKITTLERLRARALAGEDVDRMQIAVAAGEREQPKAIPSHAALRQPIETTTAEERRAYLDKVNRRNAEADPLSSAGRERMRQLREQFAEEALVRTEALMKE